jgi:hypothetical protein
MEEMDTQTRYFRIERKNIAYFKFILESYEGMAVVRTKNPEEAVVELLIAPGWEKDVEEVLEGLRQEMVIEPLPSKGTKSLPDHFL